MSLLTSTSYTCTVDPALTEEEIARQLEQALRELVIEQAQEQLEALEETYGTPLVYSSLGLMSPPV